MLSFDFERVIPILNLLLGGTVPLIQILISPPNNINITYPIFISYC